MTDLITFIENNGKSAVYTGVNIHEIYFYLEMIGAPNTLTISGQRSHHFGPSSSTKNDTENLQTFITALLIIQRSIYELCGSIGHKADA